MSKDSSFYRNQKKEEERSIVLDFSGSLGKGMLAKEKIETLGNSSRLTPIGFDSNDRNRIMNREPANLDFFTPEYKGNTETLSNSPGLSTLHPFDELYRLKKKSVSLIEGFSTNEDLETLKNSSGLNPLNYDSKPPMDAANNRNSLQRRQRMQSLGLTDFAFKGE